VQPRGIAVTFDGKYLITANKNTSDRAVFSTPRLRLVKRIHIGDSPEFIKVDSAGDRLFATFEPGSSGRPLGARGAKDDADEQNELP
jgi:DNA-binding beta-propeller fold protein YncE